eukprot:757490-Hanusia_phi.AAC.10
MSPSNTDNQGPERLRSNDDRSEDSDPRDAAGSKFSHAPPGPAGPARVGPVAKARQIGFQNSGSVSLALLSIDGNRGSCVAIERNHAVVGLQLEMREGGKEAGRQARREGGRQGGREAGKEGGMEGWRDGGMEGGKKYFEKRILVNVQGRSIGSLQQLECDFRFNMTRLCHTTSMKTIYAEVPDRHYQIIAHPAQEELALKLVKHDPKRFTYHPTVTTMFLMAIYLTGAGGRTGRSSRMERTTLKWVSAKLWEEGRPVVTSDAGGFNPVNYIRGAHVLFLASFHNNDVTLSQFHVGAAAALPLSLPCRVDRASRF